MSSTRSAIRIEAGRMVQECLSGTATGGTTTTLVDATNLLDAGDSLYNFVGGWIKFTSGTFSGTVKRISSFSPSSGTITWSSALSGAIVAAVTYEIHLLLNPDEWDRCINRALRECTRRRQETIAIVQNQRQYSLAAYTDLTEPDYVYKMELRYGATTDQYTYTELPVYLWDVREDDDAFVLSFSCPMPYNPTNTALIMHYYGPYADLTSDSDTTNINLSWVVSGTLKYMWELYGHGIEMNQIKIVGLEKDEIIRDFTAKSVRYSPEIVYPVKVPW